MSSPVRVLHVSKRFRIGESHDSLRDLLAHVARRVFRRGRSAQAQSFLAVNDVSFEVGRGEAVGVIGPNGAGKSTVLKLLAGILRPDSGALEVRGRRAALIEVGAGFHGDLTGRENIHLNGTILGMGRDEIRRKMDAIVAFAGVDRFLDTPVKRYSSGMYARLGFSIAAHVDPAVLLVDEVLSVGDAAFRIRCLERMRSLVRGGTALVFVTHDLEQMRTICDRTIVLENGGVAFEGAPSAAIAQYLRAMSRCHAGRPTDTDGGRDSADRRLRVIDLRMRDESGRETESVGTRESIVVELSLRADRTIRRAAVELNLRRAEGGEVVASFNSGRSGRYFTLREGKPSVALRLESLPIGGGQYFWNARVWDADSTTTELDTPFQYPLIVDDGGRPTGLLAVEHEWSQTRASIGESHVVGGDVDESPAKMVEREGATVERLPVR